MERVILGAHDGLASWTLNVGAERSSTEQRLVSVHERAHHDLHQSSPWGFAMVVLASAPGALEGTTWQWMAEGCRTAHEAFATYFSVTSDPTYGPLLDGNADYLRYLRLAEDLGAHAAIPENHRRLMIDALLRAALAPAELGRLTTERLRSLRLIDVPDAWLPDARLTRIARLVQTDAASLARALAQLDERPGYPGFRDALATELTALGVATMTTDDHHGWASEIADTLTAQAAGRFSVVSTPEDQVDSAFDDFQRERLRLHDPPLPLVLTSPQSPDWDITLVARDHPYVGRHGWLVWIREDLLGRQFQLPVDSIARGRPVLGLLSVDRRAPTECAYLWHLEDDSPALVAAVLRERSRIPALLFTTFASMLDSDDGDDFRGIDPVFILIDVPLDGFMDRAQEEGAALGWDIAWIEGDHEIAVFVFANDALPGTYFLLPASHGGHDAILAWMLRRPPEIAHHDPNLLGEHVGYFDALLRHLIGSFAELHLFAGHQ